MVQAHLLQDGCHVCMAADLLLPRSCQADAAASHLPDVHRWLRRGVRNKKVSNRFLRACREQGIET